MSENENHIYIAIDLKSFYASVECRERDLDPLTTNLVVAEAERTEKTICLAVSPSLKAYGIPGRARLFEVVPVSYTHLKSWKKELKFLFSMFQMINQSHWKNIYREGKIMAIGFVIAAAVIAGLQYVDNYGPQIITDNYMFYRCV